jgi:hypothetical protein
MFEEIKAYFEEKAKELKAFLSGYFDEQAKYFEVIKAEFPSTMQSPPVPVLQTATSSKNPQTPVTELPNGWRKGASGTIYNETGKPVTIVMPVQNRN